jgi:hypothetical protein
MWSPSVRILLFAARNLLAEIIPAGPDRLRTHALACHAGLVRKEARQAIGRYLDFYNARRPHAAFDRRTPDQVYYDPCRSARQPNPGCGST